MRIRKSAALRLKTQVPPDKSITHRALLLGAIAQGETLIHNPLNSEDCLATAKILTQLGVKLQWNEELVRIQGGELRESSEVLDCQNSGTTMRLLLGLLAGQDFFSILTGDASLNQRPMRRVITPLEEMGAEISGRENQYPPLAVRGRKLVGHPSYRLPVASAQLKSALLLAGLFATGSTKIVEPLPSRDHTERMLQAFGGKLTKTGNTIFLEPGPLSGQELMVPGDFSSAAFFMGAGLIVPGSEVYLEKVGLNPTRTGLLTVLGRMGAELEICNQRSQGQEPVGDLLVRGSTLKGTEIKGDIVPFLIDELPLIAVLATQAEGTTIIRDCQELRVKETDRIAALAQGLSKMGAEVDELPDGLIIHGPTPLRGAKVESFGDHRIAMALGIGGLVAEGETEISDSGCVAISFPNFWQFFGNNS